MVWKSDGRLLESDSGPPNLKNVADDVTENVAKDVVENVVENVAEDAIKCRLGRYPFLIPLMILIALLNILSYGINSAFSGLSIAPNNYDHTFVIAGFFLFNSISSAIFSISWGYLYDWLGWVFLLSVTQILLLAELVFISVNMNYEKNITLNPILNQYYVWWIIGLTAGIIDTGCNVLLNASISFTFDKQVVPYVFSWYRFIYCLSCAIFSILNYVIEPLYIIYGIIGWSLLSSTSIIIFKLRS